MIFRVYGLDKSLTLDEFGTLWTVECDLDTLLARTLEFQGQAPFYYLFAWLSVHGLGETEILLRLPSLLFGTAAAYVIYRLGLVADGKEVGLLSASLAWLSFSFVEASAMARPYAVAGLMAALMLFGFSIVTLEGRQWGRLLFIAGGAGVFSAHYALGLICAGVGVACLLFSELREHYRLSQFALDVAIQLLAVLVWLPHLRALWGRRGQLQWLVEADYGGFLAVIGPLVVFALAGRAAGIRRKLEPKERAFEAVLWLGIAAQVGTLSLLALAGTNLLSERYMSVIIIPAAVLAAKGILAMPRNVAVLPWSYWVGFTGGALIGAFFTVGSFSSVGFQDWRHAVAQVDSLVRAHPGALVLYRSGLVEDDGHPLGDVSSAVLSPLRSPGNEMPPWNVVPLTYSWWAPSREQYFEREVAPKVEDSAVVYFLTSDFYTDSTGNYPELVRQWIEERFPGRFSAEWLPAGRGMVLLRFRKEAKVSASKSETR